MMYATPNSLQVVCKGGGGCNTAREPCFGDLQGQPPHSLDHGLVACWAVQSGPKVAQRGGLEANICI